MMQQINLTNRVALIFPVSDVLPAERLLSEVPYPQAIDKLLKRTQPQTLQSQEETFDVFEFESEEQPPAPPNRTIEACSNSGGQLVGAVNFHPFMAALHLAFNDHRPLSLSPDMIWLLISQGFAQHVNLHAESLRNKLVAHQGQCTITVQRNDFVKGSPKNPWSEVFGEFSAIIRQHLGETTHDLLVPTFSTTGPVEKAASEIVLLDAVRSYFRFELITMCGIPQIQLEGTVADWQDLLQRTKQLAQFELGWWIEKLIPVLEQFVVTAQGKPSRAFWQSIYRYEEISGGDIITGWISAFFPYLNNKETGETTRNPTLTANEGSLTHLFEPDCFESENPWAELSIDKLSSGLANAPFIWRYLWHRYPMEFMSGFVGVQQDRQTLCLRPEIGWIVCDVIQ